MENTAVSIPVQTPLSDTSIANAFKVIQDAISRACETGDLKMLSDVQMWSKDFDDTMNKHLRRPTIQDLPTEILTEILHQVIFGKVQNTVYLSETDYINNVTTKWMEIELIPKAPWHKTQEWKSMCLVSHQWRSISRVFQELSECILPSPKCSSSSIFRHTLGKYIHIHRECTSYILNVDLFASQKFLEWTMQVISRHTDIKKYEIYIGHVPDPTNAQKYLNTIGHASARYYPAGTNERIFTGSVFRLPSRGYFYSIEHHIGHAHTVRFRNTYSTHPCYNASHKSNCADQVVPVDPIDHFFCRDTMFYMLSVATSRMNAKENVAQLHKNGMYLMRNMYSIRTLELFSMDLNCDVCFSGLPPQLERLEFSSPRISALVGPLRPLLVSKGATVSRCGPPKIACPTTIILKHVVCDMFILQDTKDEFEQTHQHILGNTDQCASLFDRKGSLSSIPSNDENVAAYLKYLTKLPAVESAKATFDEYYTFCENPGPCYHTIEITLARPPKKRQAKKRKCNETSH